MCEHATYLVFVVRKRTRGVNLTGEDFFHEIVVGVYLQMKLISVFTAHNLKPGNFNGKL